MKALMTIKYFSLFVSLLFFSFQANNLPQGWTKIEKLKIGNQKMEVYFFDYMTRLEILEPNLSQLKGRAFTNRLQKIQCSFPTYVAKRKLDESDSLIFYVLRPNESKIDRPFYFDLEIVKANADFPLDSLEEQNSYADKILKTVPAIGCRGSIVSEHNLLIQNNPDKAKLIGNGIQITDSIFTRVIPYEEIKKSFSKLIESNL